MKLLLALAILLTLGVPGSRTTLAESRQTDPQVDPPSGLQSGWDALSTAGFEQYLSRFRAAPPVLSVADLGQLGLSLDRQDVGSVRAALLLAHALDARADEVLCVRLERRVPAPGRAWDAGDIVAAAALAGRGLERGLPVRLAALAAGPKRHPDLEVRVECARAALRAGDDGVLSFLLNVVRAGTDAEQGIDWTPSQTMAWSKSRAAEGLASRAGVPCDFRPDGGLAEQAAWARAIESVLKR